MFENRLQKVYKHKSKLARRQNITCYRVYDHDLPEFPFSIELYGNHVYVAEYLRRHGMEEEAHDAWMSECLQIISTVLDVEVDHIYTRERRRMSHRSQQQYEKINLHKEFFTVTGKWPVVSGKPDRLCGYRAVFRPPHYEANGEGRSRRKTRAQPCFAIPDRFRCMRLRVLPFQVTSVDLSKTYLQLGRRQFRCQSV